ncbi:MAG: SusD/RagB family nutrient-binding outer membrane lipoprotein [Polaribacter sp.]|uniref:SusD/RagB family nutrient-binding outer membrane lipoprotein n=1 Tax=Polaribacter sp. TaxID=1920175 RepID=UPI002F359FC2
MKKTIKNIALLICVSIFYSSCDSIDFGDINDNPNGPTSAVTSQLLTSAQTSIGNSVVTSMQGILYTQQLTEGQYPGFSRYATLTSSYNGWYTGPIQNLNEIIKINSDTELMGGAAAFGDNNNQMAVAKIMRAYYLQYITDRWGALPWSEAFQGISFPQPKFDSQEELYTLMFAEIEEALTLINLNAGPQGDIIFSGDMTRWRMFANTLKMTMALRISDANASLAKSKFEEAVAAGVVRSNSDNILFNFGTDDNSDNPWEDRFESRVDYLLSETMASELRSNLDPRLFKFVEPSRDGSTTSTNFPGGIDAKFVGAPNGYVNGNVQDYSLPTTTVTGNQAYKSPIYTAAHVNLSLAEAKLKGWNVGSGTTASFFKEGIEDSMSFWGVDQADIDAYTAAHTSSTLANIAYEKWVALYLNGPEAWAEWRRLDMPVLTPSGNAVDPRIPVRDAYDSSVEDNNATNYAAVVASQGADDLHTKLWWDKN